jgi:hypothetical protein
MVNYDGTVRNSLEDVLQFIYGEDGMAGAFIERQRIEASTSAIWSLSTVIGWT